MAAVVTLAVLGAGYGLFRPRLRRSTLWKATVTPLASIIGSGFLVVAPLLAAAVGRWAPVGMAAVVAVGYAMGWVMRYVVATVEPVLGDDPPAVLADLDRLSEIALSFAYTVSVAFYLRLLASFLLRPFDGDAEPVARLVATVLMLGIGVVGWRRGFEGMEVVEETAVDIKLSIIAGLITGLVVFDVVGPGGVGGSSSASPAADPWSTARTLAGMVIVVQGFETSRYLGSEFDAAVRVKTMRLAQWISGGIYLVFVSAMVPLFGTFPLQVSDTAIVDAAVTVTPILGPLVFVAAVASQLSAAVADTAGGGAMLVEGRRRSRQARAGYAAVLAGAATIVWISNVFEIVAFASRAFAVYYLLQTISAILVAFRTGVPARKLAGFGAVAVVMAFVVVFGLPVG